MELNIFLTLGLQFWTNMKPYSDQHYGPDSLPYTVGVSRKNNLIDQKISVHKLWPGYHTTIYVVPKILETSPNFDNLDLDKRKCKLPHETTGFRFLQEYTQKGCEIECAAKKAISFCRCLPWYYPNDFTSLPTCDMFGGFCFNKIMSDEVFYKNCKSECLADCQEISLSVWQKAVPLNIEELCREGAYFDKFLEQNFEKIFSFEYLRSFVQEQRIPDLASSLSNGSMCVDYVEKYVSFVSVESPTESVSKSQLDISASFNDQLGIIGGNLGLCVGMSVLGMVEASLFIYIVLKSVIQDMNTLRKTILSFFKVKFPLKEVPLQDVKVCRGLSDHRNEEDDDFEENEEMKRLYVSNILVFLVTINSKFYTKRQFKRIKL